MIIKKHCSTDKYYAYDETTPYLASWGDTEDEAYQNYKQRKNIQAVKLENYNAQYNIFGR